MDKQRDTVVIHAKPPATEAELGRRIKRAVEAARDAERRGRAPWQVPGARDFALRRD